MTLIEWLLTWLVIEHTGMVIFNLNRYFKEKKSHQNDLSGWERMIGSLQKSIEAHHTDKSQFTDAIKIAATSWEKLRLELEINRLLKKTIVNNGEKDDPSL